MTTVGDPAPTVVQEGAQNAAILVAVVSLWFSHTVFDSLAMAAAAFAMRLVLYANNIMESRKLV